MDDLAVYKDQYLGIFNKPSGVSLLPNPGEKSFFEVLAEKLNSKKLYQVHRIDKDTSGLVIIAFDPKVQSELTKQFFNRTVNKEYLAVVKGEVEPKNAVVDLPICFGRKRKYRVAGKRENIVLKGESFVLEKEFTDRKIFPSTTEYEVVQYKNGFSYLKVKPITGRRHQIRVHLSWLGWSIVGDHLYDKKFRKTDGRLRLHSYSICYIDTWSGKSKRVKHAGDLPEFWNL